MDYNNMHLREMFIYYTDPIGIFNIGRWRVLFYFIKCVSNIKTKTIFENIITYYCVVIVVSTHIGDENSIHYGWTVLTFII